MRPKPERVATSARLALLMLGIAIMSIARNAAAAPPAPPYRIDHVADGDTVDLTNGQRVRLVQIDTPEVYFLGVLRTPSIRGNDAAATTGHAR